MTTLKAAVSALALICAATPALSASATPEGARALAATFETYLGKTVAGPGGMMRVTTNGTGDGYDVSVDFSPLIALIHIDSGVKVAPVLLSFTLLPQDNGTWRYRQSGFPTLSVTSPTISYTTTYAGFEAEGVFDPRLAAFTSWSARQSSSIVTSSDALTNIEATLGASTASGTSRVSTTGKGVDASLTSTSSGLVEKVVLKDTNNTAVTVTARSFKMYGSGAAVMSREILDLWSFLVSNPSPEQVRLVEKDLRARLSAILPIFNTVDVGVDVEGLAVDSPIGRFGISRLGFTEAFSGAVPKGFFAIGFKTGEVTLPPALLPAWATGLIPKETDISTRISGFDLDRIAREAIVRLDLSRTPPLNMTDEEMGRMVLPTGDLVIELPKGKAVAPLYSLSWEGSMTVNVGTKLGTGKARIVAKGLDEVITALTNSKVPDAMNVVTGLYAAKAFAKPGAPGEYSWDIVGSTAGDVTINGNRLPFGK